MNLSESQLADGAPDKVIEGIMRVRQGRVRVIPGYDGVYGEVHIFDDKKNGDG
jgi:PHP family Zn ribbon phosphoesterase